MPPLLRLLARCPLGVAEAVLAGVGVGQAAFQPSAARRALAWADAQGVRGSRRWRLALSLLASRGRYLALKMLPAMLAPDEFRERLVVRGLEGLETVPPRSGRILLVFHLGPGLAHYALALHGHRGVSTPRQALVHWVPAARPDWAGILPAVVVRFPENARGRVSGLVRLRKLLLAGETVYLAADGSAGAPGEAMRIPVRGGEVILKPGWWLLRRLTAAPTFPVLVHLEGRTIVVTVHPALPPPVPDAEADVAACRAALTPILSEYVRRYPEQCRSLAFWPKRFAPANGPSGE